MFVGFFVFLFSLGAISACHPAIAVIVTSGLVMGVLYAKYKRIDLGSLRTFALAVCLGAVFGTCSSLGQWRRAQDKASLAKLTPPSTKTEAAKSTPQEKGDAPTAPVPNPTSIPDREASPVSQEDRETARRRAVTDGIAAAEKIASDKELCDTAKSIAEAWQKLKQVTSSDQEWKKAKGLAKKLEKCRLSVEKAFQDAVIMVMVSQREDMATRMETTLLEQGIDARVSLKGKTKNEMTVQWILMTRPIAYKLIVESGLGANLEKAGFKKVTLTNGYGDSFYQDLNPSSEEGAGRMALEGLGLDKPITL